MKSMLRKVGLAGSLLIAGPAAAAPEVLVSIAPIHSLTAAVMEGVGEPELLVPPNVSDHDFAMRPSDLRKIAGADLVIWVGEPLEAYLAKPLETEGVASLELIHVPGIEPMEYSRAVTREEEAEGDDHAHGADEGRGHADADHAGGGHDHAHEQFGLDPHIWLDPLRAKAIVSAIAEQLSELDPANADRFRTNASRAAAELDLLHGQMQAQLAPFADRPFVTFHDGYSYLVARYGLNQVGQLSVHPEQQAGAASVRALRDMAQDRGVVCAFAEPQFDPAVVESLAGSAGIKVGVLDALGAGFEPGPSLYSSLLRKNSEAIAACLASTS